MALKQSVTDLGILADHQIEQLFAFQQLKAARPLDVTQIQPASLDLRLGSVAHRLRASFLPNGRPVEECLHDGMSMGEFSLEDGAVLERGCVYLVRLQEQFALTQTLTAHANPKSSTGRADVFVRLICDCGRAFDQIPGGYHGAVYVEICPSTFPVRIRTGERLLQARFREGPRRATRDVVLRLDLSLGANQIVGYRARRHTHVLDLGLVSGHNPADFWEPITAHQGRILLDPGEFYILSSLDNVEIGLDEAAEMLPIAPELGEFRAHYAGFFDPGFGLSPFEGRAVLEVRSRDVPFLVEHGQIVGRLEYEPMLSRPNRPYGQQGNHYRGQKLKLSKHFHDWPT
jgi:dCTP deaminase